MNDRAVHQPIRDAKPTPGTLVEACFNRPDYRDTFLVDTDGFTSINEFASAYFLRQPRWLSLVSMNVLTRDKLLAAVGDRTYPAGSAVGSWKIHDRTDTEILFGDDMGFMEYRFSLLLRPDGNVEASTAVKYRWRRASGMYFAIVKPMHRRFVPISLKAALLATTVARAETVIA